jgi:pimeloyl-ACP methyl ester carboxylesterase
VVRNDLFEQRTTDNEQRGLHVRRSTIVLIAVVTLVVAVAATFAWWIRFRPFAVFAFQTRRALGAAGLERGTVASPIGAQVVFRGGSGPVLVLLHGAGDQAGTWSRVVPGLVKTHALLVPDLAGHGDSAPAEGPISVPMLLDGVEAVIGAAARERPVTVAGNSLGAWLAMLVAHRHPEWVGRVVAINGGAIKGTSDANLLPGTRAEARELMALLRDPGSPRVPDWVLDDVIRLARTGPLARFAATRDTMEPFTLDGRLGELRVPVEIVWGASDRVMPLEYAERMRVELPDARVIPIERCGHAPQVECPDKLLAALRQAVDGSQPPADSSDPQPESE